MTLTTTHNRIEYVGNASTTVFPYDFLIPAATDLMVFHDDVVQTLGYTISGVGEASGGNVTYSVAPADDVVIVFIRATDQTQQVNLIEGDRLPAEAVEGMFDKIYAVAQDLAERMDRTVRIPPTSDAADETVFLPDPADPANQDKALFIGTDGQLETRTILSSDIASPISAQGDLIRGSSGATPERLPIGTAGQLLTVVTGQAAWATPSASGIQSTLIDAKGDLVAGTAADTVGRLGAGADGTLLSADSTQTTGLGYVDPQTLPGARYSTYAPIAEPATPAAGTAVLYQANDPSATNRPRWKDASGATMAFQGIPSHLRFAGNPYKEVVSTAALTSIFTTPPTIYASTLGTDRMLRITILGDVFQNVATARGFTLHCSYGGTTFASMGGAGLLPQSATRYGYRVVARLAARGATNAQVGQGELLLSSGGGVSGGGGTIISPITNAFASWHTAIAENSATDLALNIFIAPEISSASLSIRVFSVLVEWL